MMRDPSAVKKEAVAWYAHLCSGEATTADHEEHQRWCTAHPDNLQAWHRFEAMRQSFSNVPANVATTTLSIAAKSRRRTVRSALLLIAAGSTGAAGYALWRSDRLSSSALLADYRTSIGEQRSLTLSDGSLLMLNTNTVVDVIFDDRQRLIRLHAGELLVETVAHLLAATSRDADIDSRPLMVATRHGRVRALGTRFTVRRFDDRSEVTVIDSAVEVRPQDNPAQHLVITRGMRVAFSERELFAARSADVQDDWSGGSLVISDWRLGDLLEELGRYRQGLMECDAEAADLRVSGAFPLLDTDRALKALERSLPVKISYFTRYWVRVAAVGR